MATEKEFIEKLKEIKEILDEEATLIRFDLHEKIHDLHNIINEILKEVLK